MADSDNKKPLTGNALLDALPPATDYMTYLTIVEYNLTRDTLPTLHGILQDTELTSQIGWDLVHLLLPLLPESESCLTTIANVGNAREVLLKTTEALRVIVARNAMHDFDDESELDDEILPSNEGNQSLSREGRNALRLLQFEVLISMLSTLHSRIKTKYPSRFLATTLQAIVIALSSFRPISVEIVSRVLQFLKTVLPNTNADLHPAIGVETSISDPKSGSIPQDEAIQNRLIQSFITHVLELFLCQCNSDDDTPGLCWTSRAAEVFRPGKVDVRKVTYRSRFETEEQLQERSRAMSEIDALGKLVNLTNMELTDAITNYSHAEQSRTDSEEVDPPNSSEEIPLSAVGALFLLTHRVINQVITTPEMTPEVPNIFPIQAKILQDFVQDDPHHGGEIGNEPPALIDAILALAQCGLQFNKFGQPADDEQFKQYLQTLSLICANMPLASLRNQAYFITSAVLRSNPSKQVRLEFIRDTLEHCPYENLKACAVTWFKSEVLDTDKSSFSANKEAFDTVSPYLFPSLDDLLEMTDMMQKWMTLKANMNFYLAILNFYFLLVKTPSLQNLIHIQALCALDGMGRMFWLQISALSKQLKDGLESRQDDSLKEQIMDTDGTEGVQATYGELSLLDVTLENIHCT